MNVSLAFFGITELVITLVKAAVILAIILIFIKMLNGKPKENSFNSTYSSKKYNKSFNWDKPKRKSIFSIFKHSKDVDCDLDERIFGPKNQHKDLF